MRRFIVSLSLALVVLLGRPCQWRQHPGAGGDSRRDDRHDGHDHPPDCGGLAIVDGNGRGLPESSSGRLRIGRCFRYRAPTIRSPAADGVTTSVPGWGLGANRCAPPT